MQQSDETRTCKRCGENKPITEYYTRRAAGGRQTPSWVCKECKRREVRESYYARKGQKSSEPRSTSEGREILVAQGIPVNAGYELNMPWVDLFAWGCIPIEPKGANEGGWPNQFQWGFTYRQREKWFKGFFLFIAWPEKGSRRVFVVPTDVDWLMDEEGKSQRTALSVVIGSHHEKSYLWNLLKPYENAFHLIEQARLAHSEKLRRGDP